MGAEWERNGSGMGAACYMIGISYQHDSILIILLNIYSNELFIEHSYIRMLTAVFPINKQQQQSCI